MGRLHNALLRAVAQKGTPTTPVYEQILARMAQEQPALKEALVCWYSPKLQGLTNEELASHYPTFTDGLKDLSGNGHDMTLYGMNGTSSGGCVDADGHLCFDGVDDYGQRNENMTIEDFSLFFDGKATYNSYASVISTRESTEYPTIALNYVWNDVVHNFSLGAINSTESRKSSIADGLRVMTKNKLITPIETYTLQSGNKYDINLINIATMQQKSRCITKLLMRSFTLFSRTLTDSEISYVKTNLIEI